MSIPKIDPYPPAPTPEDSEEVFDDKAYEHAASLEPRRIQMNDVAVYVNSEVDRANTRADAAAASATASANSATRSDEWANKAPGSVVASGKYSARHYSDLSDKFANAPEDVEVEPGKFSALHWQEKAKKIADVHATTVATDPLPTVIATNVQEALRDLAYQSDQLRVAKNQLKYGDGPYPVLDFQFQGANMLDPRIEFTRASTDWGFDAEGNYRELDINQPVFDYDPLTGEPLGVRVWPQRRYLLPHSSNFVGWTMFGDSTIEENVLINSYGDSFFKLFSSQDETPIIRTDYTFGLHEQEVSIIARPASLSCVMLRVVAGADVRVTVDLITLNISVSNINSSAVKVRRLTGDDIEIRVVYTPTTPSGRFDIWAKRHLDTSVGLSDIVAGEHIYISSCSVCDQIGAPYVRTGESQVTVSSQYMSTDLNLGAGVGTYIVSLLDCGQTTSHAGPLHIKRTYRDIYGAAIRLRAWTTSYLPAVGGSAILRGDSDSTQGGINKETLEKKAGISILPDGSAFFSMGGEGVPIGAMPLTDLGRISLGEVRISGSGERTMRGYIKSMTYYPRPLDLDKLKETTTL